MSFYVISTCTHMRVHYISPYQKLLSVLNAFGKHFWVNQSSKLKLPHLPFQLGVHYISPYLKPLFNLKPFGKLFWKQTNKQTCKLRLLLLHFQLDKLMICWLRQIYSLWNVLFSNCLFRPWTCSISSKLFLSIWSRSKRLLRLLISFH